MGEADSESVYDLANLAAAQQGAEEKAGEATQQKLTRTLARQCNRSRGEGQRGAGKPVRQR